MQDVSENIYIIWQFFQLLIKNKQLCGDKMSKRPTAFEIEEYLQRFNYTDMINNINNFNGETLERIEEIIQKVKGMLTEIAVVDYKQSA